MRYRLVLYQSYTFRPFFSPHRLFPPSFVSLGRFSGCYLGFPSWYLSIFFRAAIYCSLFFGMHPSHFLAAVFLFWLWLILFLTGVFSRLPCGSSLLSCPSSVPAHLLRCFWLHLLFLSTRRFSAHLLLMPLFEVPYPLLLLRLPIHPLLVTCLPSPVVRVWYCVLPSSFSSLSPAPVWVGVVNPFGSLIHWVSFPLAFWWCCSFALLGRSITMVTILLFLCSCCSPSLIGVVALSHSCASFLVPGLRFLPPYPLSFF